VSVSYCNRRVVNRNTKAMQLDVQLIGIRLDDISKVAYIPDVIFHYSLL
jgi:hypothetical protein